MRNNRPLIGSLGKLKAVTGKALSSGNGKQPSAWVHAFVVIVILSIVAGVIYWQQDGHRQTTELATEQFNQQQLILARSVASGIEHFITDVDDDVLALSNFPAVQRMEPGILERMEVLYQGIPPETSSRRLDKNGILRFIYPDEGWRQDLVGRDYKDKPWFQKTKETGEVVVSGLVINEAGECRIRVARPVYITDETGVREFNGVIACSFNLDTLDAWYISPVVSGETGYAWLLNEDGIFLAHHEEEFVNKDAFVVRQETNPDISYDAINDIQKKMLAGEEGTANYLSGWHRGQEGEVEKLIAYTPVSLDDRAWSVAVCAPVWEVERIAEEAYRDNLYASVLIILAITAAGCYFFIVLYRRTQSLQREIARRERVEGELRKHREHLEELVKERTSALEEKTIALERANIRLQEADRLKSVFLASMSHELRTPLNSIIGFTGIILKGMTGEINEEQGKQLSMVRNSANHLLSLINDLLDISKIESGRVDMSLEEFNLNSTVREIAETLSHATDEKSLELITEVPEGVTLLSDKRRVKQVLINLLGNAVKFTNQGSVQITAEVLKDENLEIHVTDTGIGIKKEDMNKLFEPFQQIDMPLTMVNKGTGLGLYLTRKLAALLGGNIAVKSEYGRGSDFIFTIPLKYKEVQKK